MADVITRFKLETTQYDSKLRDESNRLAEFTRKVSMAGKEFDRFAASQVEAVRELGKMGPAATDAKDKVKELVAAYNALAKQYNVLTKEQQQGDYGKAMAESLKSLQQQITAAKNEMNSTGGVLDKLKERFTVNIDALKLFNIGLQAAKGALDVAKDAFFASESNVDDWGRTMRASKSLYEGFLTALNTGDISGYLSNIQTIVSAAKDAYNAIDRLSTQKAIDNPRLKAQEVENERFRAMLRTGRYIAPNDGRKATMAEGTMLSKETLSVIARMLENGMKTTNSIVRTEIDNTSEAIKALYKEQAARLNMSYKEFVRGTSSMGEFEKRLKGYQSYMDYERAHTYTPTAPYPGAAVRPVRDNTVNPFSQYRAWGVFKDDGSLYNEILGLVNQRAGLQSQNYNSIAQMYRAINRVGNGAGTGPGAGGGTVNSTEETLEQINATILEQWQAVVRGMDVDTSKLKAVEPTGPSDAWEAYTKSQEENTDGLKSLTDALKKLNEKEGITGDSSQPPATKSAKDMAKDLSQATQTLSSISNGINSIFSGLESLGVDIPENLKGIMSGITGVMTILTGISSLVLTITAIQGAKAIPVIGTFLASGGIVHAAGGYVGGNSYSNDNIPAMLDAGEVVLNKAQQGNIASQLQDGNRQMQIVGEIEGENIVLVANRSLKRSGRGELVTWKN